MRKIKVAVCSLNQWAMDFEGNLKRIIQSIKDSKDNRATLRIGPELEVTGYGCNDHFLELDTILHSWQVINEILTSKVTDGILCDIGMPINFKNCLLNCRIILFNSKILMIRPKLYLANSGNYREKRWFIGWPKYKADDFILPDFIQETTSQHSVKIGDLILQTSDTLIGFETCEEMFVVDNPAVDLVLNGVEIILNSSASHHELRKLESRFQLIHSTVAKSGGLYLYSNLKGCDGERVYYDSSSLICLNGELLAQGTQFSLDPIEIIYSTVDLDQVLAVRSFVPNERSLIAQQYEKIILDFKICSSLEKETEPAQLKILKPEQEIALGPACWLWNYLVTSKGSGFFLPLSGGVDSGSVALIVFSMCQLVLKSDQALIDLKDIVGDQTFSPLTAQEIMNKILFTCYMPTDNSSNETKSLALEISSSLGSSHSNFPIQSIFEKFCEVLLFCLKLSLRYKIHGGSNQENLALQNLQARIRMVSAYLLAQTIPTVKQMNRPLLVLGTANVDESLRGYFTKYDNSSADLDPIGGISKTDLYKFVQFMGETNNLDFTKKLIHAVPSAELEPQTKDHKQTDEQDMGFTFSELNLFGKLFKINRLGPYSMYLKLKDQLLDASDKVKRFFYYFGLNRHKMTTLTPSYHAEAYSPDDNRFDQRPFLYSSWSFQFKQIDQSGSK